MLGHEPVHDPARRAAAEGARQPRRVTRRERVALRRWSPGLRRQHQRGADLRRHGARAHDRGHGGAVGDPARPDQRQRHPVGDQPQRRQQAQLIGVRPVREIPPVPARLEALYDQRVRPAVTRLHGLVGIRDRHPHVAAGPLKRLGDLP